MSTSLIPANITIADRQFRIKVAPTDEESVRHSVKVINEKILEFKKAFPGKDMQDYISMVLVWFATDYKINASNSTNENEIITKLDQLENLVAAQLNP